MTDLNIIFLNLYTWPSFNIFNVINQLEIKLLALSILLCRILVDAEAEEVIEWRPKRIIC